MKVCNGLRLIELRPSPIIDGICVEIFNLSIYDQVDVTMYWRGCLYDSLPKKTRDAHCGHIYFKDGCFKFI